MRSRRRWVTGAAVVVLGVGLALLATRDSTTEEPRATVPPPAAANHVLVAELTASRAPSERVEQIIRERGHEGSGEERQATDRPTPPEISDQAARAFFDEHPEVFGRRNFEQSRERIVRILQFRRLAQEAREARAATVQDGADPR